MSTQMHYSVGNEAMDALHDELVALLEAALRNPEDFLAGFAAMMEHTREHFAFENELLRTFRPASMHEHLAEHERLLAEMDYFYAKALQGRTPFARAYLKEKLPDWLRHHTASMDADLARALKQADADDSIA